MLVLDSDAIQASAAVVAAGPDDLVLVLRHGLLSATELACLRGVLAPVVARLGMVGADELRNTG